MGYCYSVWGVLLEKKLVAALDGGKAGEFDLSTASYYAKLQEIEKNANWQVVIVGEDDHEYLIEEAPEHLRFVMLCNCSLYFEDEDYKEDYKKLAKMYNKLLKDGWKLQKVLYY